MRIPAGGPLLPHRRGLSIVPRCGDTAGPFPGETRALSPAVPGSRTFPPCEEESQMTVGPCHFPLTNEVAD